MPQYYIPENFEVKEVLTSNEKFDCAYCVVEKILFNQLKNKKTYYSNKKGNVVSWVVFDTTNSDLCEPTTKKYFAWIFGSRFFARKFKNEHKKSLDKSKLGVPEKYFWVTK